MQHGLHLQGVQTNEVWPIFTFRESMDYVVILLFLFSLWPTACVAPRWRWCPTTPSTLRWVHLLHLQGVSQSLHKHHQSHMNTRSFQYYGTSYWAASVTKLGSRIFPIDKTVWPEVVLFSETFNIIIWHSTFTEVVRVFFTKYQLSHVLNFHTCSHRTIVMQVATYLK